MNDEQFERYSRQMLLPQIGRSGQQRLLDSRVLVVGAGGLGSPVLLYLAGAGVGTLVVSDFDVVDTSNLHRQVIHGRSDVGQPKVISAKASISALNPDVQVIALNRALDGAELRDEVARADAVVDCSDNFETRFALNAVCVAAGTPLVSGAAIRAEGQVAVFPNRGGTPCYRCLYRDGGEAEGGCDMQGVVGPVVGVIGSMQALETLKLLLGIGESLAGRLLMFDGLAAEWRSLRLPRDPHCPVCGAPTPDTVTTGN